MRSLIEIQEKEPKNEGHKVKTQIFKETAGYRISVCNPSPFNSRWHLQEHTHWLREAVMDQTQMARVFGGLSWKRKNDSIDVSVYMSDVSVRNYRFTNLKKKNFWQNCLSLQLFSSRKAKQMQISVNVHANIDTVGEVVQEVFSGSKIRICITAFLCKIRQNLAIFNKSR
jgi:hypothetical protein